MFDFLNRPFFDKRFGYSRALRIACEYGSTNAVSLLLQRCRCSKYLLLRLRCCVVNPAYNGNEAFRIAVENGHLDILKLLANNVHVNPSARSQEALKNASMNGHLETVNFLVEECGLNQRVKFQEPLRLAIANGHSRVVDYLTQKIEFSTVHKTWKNRFKVKNSIKKLLELLLLQIP